MNGTVTEDPDAKCRKYIKDPQSGTFCRIKPYSLGHMEPPDDCGGCTSLTGLFPLVDPVVKFSGAASPIGSGYSLAKLSIRKKLKMGNFTRATVSARQRALDARPPHL